MHISGGAPTPPALASPSPTLSAAHERACSPADAPDATATSRLYSGVFGGLNDPRPGAEAEALLRLGAQVRALGLPLVVTDRSGRVTAAANLPFEAPINDPRVKAYAARLDRWNPPIV